MGDPEFAHAGGANFQNCIINPLTVLLMRLLSSQYTLVNICHVIDARLELSCNMGFVLFLFTWEVIFGFVVKELFKKFSFFEIVYPSQSSGEEKYQHILL